MDAILSLFFFCNVIVTDFSLSLMPLEQWVSLIFKTVLKDRAGRSRFDDCDPCILLQLPNNTLNF